MKNTKTFLTGAKVLLLGEIDKKLTEKVQFLCKNKKNRVKRNFFTKKFGSMKKKL